MRLRNYTSAVVVLLVIATVAATSVTVVVTERLTARSGLRGSYWIGTDVQTGSPVLQTIDSDPSRELVRHRARVLGHQPFSAEWEGYLVVPKTAGYRFAVPADDAAFLHVDGRIAASHEMSTGSSAVDLSRGLHHVRLRYLDAGGQQSVALLWARDDGVFTRVPPILLVPDLQDPREVRLRRLIAAVNPALPWIWWMLMCLALAHGLRQVRARLFPCPGDSRENVWVLRVLLLASVLLFVPGLCWGVPDYGTWVPDEIAPSDVLLATEHRFAGGWASIYPPLHHALLAFLYVPFQAAVVLGLTDLRDLRSYADLVVVGRMLSVAMGVGIVALTYTIAREQFGLRAAGFAATVISVAMPLTYYAKTANLDVPYVFWLCVSLLFYLRAYRSGRAIDFYLFALAGAGAICTKDQAYGFFVIPALVMIVRSIHSGLESNRPAGVPSRGTLARMIALTAAAVVVGYNLPFNWNGFTEHVRLITGPISEGYQMYPRTTAGYLRMSGEAFIQLGHFMSWPLFAGSVLGVGASLYAGNAACRYLLLPAISYYISFVSVVMYHYDRFFLGVAVILALVAGWWLDRWTRPGAPARRLRLALVGCAVAYALARSISLDALMIQDSRYSVERSLRSLVKPGEAVAGVGRDLPRPSAVPWTPVATDLSAVEANRPTFIIVNVGFSLRWDVTSPRRQFYQALSSGATPYRLALRQRTKVPFPLSLERRFRQVAEDRFSNLTKINPLMEVYVRQ